MDLGVMPMLGYSTFPKAPELEPQRQIEFSVLSRTLFFVGGGSYNTTDIQSSYCTAPVDPAD